MFSRKTNLLFLLPLLCTLLIYSCKTDTNEKNKTSTKDKPNLIGTWLSKGTTGGWIFNSNATGYSFYTDSKEKEDLKWTLEMSGNEPKLILTYSDGISVDYNIKDFTDNEIIIVQPKSGGKITLIKK